jgi:energy-coupling factor transport system substrate-specific component
MSQVRSQLFSLHELLIMAALAALGGVSGAAVSMIRAAIHAVVVLPGGMQFLAGIHVLWLILAVGLIRKPGAATVTGLFKGAVELLSGNPHGVLVLMYSALAGLAIDAVWLLLNARHRPTTYIIAGGVGAASNVLVLRLIASLPSQGVVYTGLAALAGVAFVSGAIFAGLLGWWLLRALQRAGAVGAQGHAASGPGRSRIRAGITALAAVVALIAAAIYLTSTSSEVRSADRASSPNAAPGQMTTPQ